MLARSLRNPCNKLRNLRVRKQQLLGVEIRSEGFLGNKPVDSVVAIAAEVYAVVELLFEVFLEPLLTMKCLWNQVVKGGLDVSRTELACHGQPVACETAPTQAATSEQAPYTTPPIKILAILNIGANGSRQRPTIANTQTKKTVTTSPRDSRRATSICHL